MNDGMRGDLLDAEYRQLLFIIKPLINHINNHHHLEKYRVWMERLSNVRPSEKLERNKYLVELANQIHDNLLKPPFIKDPPKGPLPFLKPHPKLLDQDPSTISEHFFEKKDVQWPFLTPPALKTPPKDAKKKNPKVNKSRPFQKIGKMEKGLKSETSSWCDLTDGTTGTHDTEGDDEKKKAVKSVKSAKVTRFKSKEKVTKKNEDEKNKTPASEDSDTEKCRKPTHEEVEALKLRMKDLLEVKNALRTTHCLTEDRKKTIENLQFRLSHAEKQNVELQTRLKFQEKQMVDSVENKEKEFADFKERFTQLRQKELEFVKQQHADEITAIEKKHNSQILELETKIMSLTNDFEEKLKMMTESNMSLVKQKDNEIQELQNQLKRSSQIYNEGNGEQIISLKKCISKLDKVLHRNEREYMKKIESLKQELEVKEMASQMQLQTQKADLLMRNATTKQEELKNALNSLEAKYRKMIENLHCQAMEAKKHDGKVIQDMISLLEQKRGQF